MSWEGEESWQQKGAEVCDSSVDQGENRIPKYQECSYLAQSPLSPLSPVYLKLLWSFLFIGKELKTAKVGQNQSHLFPSESFQTILETRSWKFCVRLRSKKRVLRCRPSGVSLFMWDHAALQSRAEASRKPRYAEARESPKRKVRSGFSFMLSANHSAVHWRPSQGWITLYWPSANSIHFRLVSRAILIIWRLILKPRYQVTECLLRKVSVQRLSALAPKFRTSAQAVGLHGHNDLRVFNFECFGGATPVKPV